MATIEERKIEQHISFDRETVEKGARYLLEKQKWATREKVTDRRVKDLVDGYYFYPQSSDHAEVNKAIREMLA